MNSEQFVEAVKLYVRDSAVQSQLNLLLDPPGRRPPESLKRQSEWFRGLSPEDQEMVKGVISHAVHAGIFHLFCVFDGVSVIDDEKGTFELRHMGKEITVLSPTSGDFLHELLNSD
jgi:hypothetical protein